MMTKFGYGNANIPGVYYDEENRRHLNTLRAAHAQLALSLIDEGKKDSARNLLEHFDQQVLESNFPYGLTCNRGNEDDHVSASFLLACYQCGDLKLAAKVAGSLRKDLEQQLRYYNSLGESMPNEQLAVNANMIVQGKNANLSEQQANFARDIVSSYQMLQDMEQWAKRYTGAPASPSKVIEPSR